MARLNATYHQERCAAMFGAGTYPNTAATNAFYGGAQPTNASRIFFSDFSDDPWKMATTSAAVERLAWPLGVEQPFMMLTCDGCGHCGAGVPPNKSAAITEQAVSYLAGWGIAPTAARP